MWVGDFPRGAVVKNLPANAGDMGSGSPGRSHMLRSNKARALQLLSPRVATTEGRTWSLCSATREATARKSGLHSLQLEKARAQQRRPNAAKNNLKKQKQKHTCGWDSYHQLKAWIEQKDNSCCLSASELDHFFPYLLESN